MFSLTLKLPQFRKLLRSNINILLIFKQVIWPSIWPMVFYSGEQEKKIKLKYGPRFPIHNPQTPNKFSLQLCQWYHTFKNSNTHPFSIQRQQKNFTKIPLTASKCSHLQPLPPSHSLMTHRGVFFIIFFVETLLSTFLYNTTSFAVSCVYVRGGGGRG